MDIDLLYITPFTGAVIGYFTNWLAIKMLFRPHNTKYIFGLKLPFTPGLIPKERARIAAAVSRVIENHLFTEDALIKTLMSPETVDSINGALDGYFAGLMNDGRTLGDVMNSFKNINAAVSQGNNFEEYLHGLLSAALSDEGIHKAAASFLSAKKDEVSTMTLRGILPYKTAVSLKEAAGGAVPKIAVIIQGLLDENPEFLDKLKELLFKLIDDNINGFVTLFINKNKIYESLKKSAADYFASSENHHAIIIKLWSFTDKMLDKPLGWFMSSLPKDFTGFVADRISKLGINAADFLMPGLARRFIDMIYNIKVSALAEKIKNAAPYVKPRFYGLAELIVKSGLPYIAGSLKLGKLAEEQMNAMDTKEAEEIIVSVCSRELKVITRLGGVLGFIIGLIPIIANLINAL